MYTQNKYPRCFNSDALHELTPRSAGQWLTQKLYKNHFLSQKECGQPYDFFRGANNVSQTSCAHIIYAGIIIFCTRNQILILFNNIKKVFK